MLEGENKPTLYSIMTFWEQMITVFSPFFLFIFLIDENLWYGV